jgi:hypothetical protein
MLLNIFLLILTIQISNANSSVQSKCRLDVNNQNMASSTFSLPIDNTYEIRFGSETVDLDNEVLSYAVDMECLNNTNITSSQHYYMTFHDISVEINIHNCSKTKENFLKNFKINEVNENFSFDTVFHNFLLSVMILEFKISMNNRYGGGCKETLFFVRNGKSSIFRAVQNLWDNSIFFRLIILFVILLLLTAGLFTTVILIRKFYILEKKTINLNLPLVKFTKRPNQNFEFPQGIDNKGLNTTETPDQISPECQITERPGEEIVRSIRFSVLREQFSQTEERYIKKKTNASEIRAKTLFQP